MSPFFQMEVLKNPLKSLYNHIKKQNQNSFSIKFLNIKEFCITSNNQPHHLMLFINMLIKITIKFQNNTFEKRDSFLLKS